MKIGIFLLLMAIQVALLDFIAIWITCEISTLESYSNVFLVFLKFLIVVVCAILCYFEIKILGKLLRKYGKMVWKHYQPYDMRHWCAVARLIRSKVNTGNFDCYSVKNWLGHDTINATESYIRYAEQFYNQLPVDWISCVLKPSVLARKHIEKENKKKSTECRF